MGFGGVAGRVDDLLFAAHARGPVTPAHVRQLEHVVLNGDRAASGLLPTAGNRFQLLDSAPAFADALVDDINAARHQVNLTEYAIHPGLPDGPVSWKVIDALGRRAGEGLPVTVQLDALGSGLTLRKADRIAMVQSLRDRGVDVITKRTRLGRGPLDDARLAVDHRKIAEIDGRISYGGGINVVDLWSPWYDMMLRVEGPASAQQGAVLAARFGDLGGEVTPARLEVLRRGMLAPVDDASHATRILTDGNRHRRELTDTFVQVARAADERFWLMDPYLSDPAVMGEIVDTARRLGPNAKLLLSPKVVGKGQLQDVFTDPLRRAWAYEFAQAGGDVVALPQFSHAKAWIADDVAAVTSHNKDLGSTSRNYENAIVTNDPDAVAQLEGAFHRQMGVGTLAGSDAVAGWRNLAIARRLLNAQY